MIDLKAIFGSDAAPVTAATPISQKVVLEPVPEDTSATDDPLAADPFAGWVRRRDVAGQWGWEAPDLPEWQRWWARCRFDDLPEVPVTWSVNGSAQPTPQGARPCVPRGMVDTLHLPGMRPRDGDCATLTGHQDR